MAKGGKDVIADKIIACAGSGKTEFVFIARRRLLEKMERDGELSGLFRELKGGLIQE
ncbi:MAG: hypothetical protein H6Q52_1515 [Deltaproteobacteria bacterium]|nr:hypothetical protein [Deltaproteobacteria bacterium]